MKTHVFLTALCLLYINNYSLAKNQQKEEISLDKIENSSISPSKEESSAENPVKESELPLYFEVRQNYPNPFNGMTIIEVDLPIEAGVYAVVYDVVGHAVRTIKNCIVPQGKLELKWNGANDRGAPVASGMYLLLVVADDYWDVKKMVLLK